MKQTIGNACGTIALLHALLNNTDKISFGKGSFLDRFLQATMDKTPEERGRYLEDPPEQAVNIDAIHAEAAAGGSTAAPEATADVDLHFVAFVQHNSGLFELDGRKRGPVHHGPSTPTTLLADTVAAVKRAYLSNTESLNFNLMALAAAEGSD